MNFLNPAMLIGLAAAAIPIAIHLLHRSRATPIAFSNLALLRSLHQSRVRRVRIRQWLILLLRSLIILLLVFAFARPTSTDGGFLLGRPRPGSVVVLLDCSFSTTQGGPEGQLFDRLQQQAFGLVKVLDGRDKVYFVPSDESPHKSLQDLDGAQLQSRIKNATPGQGARDMGPSLVEAARLLQSETKPPEVFIFTDMARRGWEGVGRPTAWPPETTVYICVADTVARQNVRVESVGLRDWIATRGGRLQLTALVGNDGHRPVLNTGVDLYLDKERVAHQDVDLPAGESRQVDFVIPLRRAGYVVGHVEIEDDGLYLDNRRYFALNVPGHIRVRVLGSHQDDTYYVRRALDAARSTDLAIQIEVGFLEGLDRQLSDIDVLVLCNAERLNSSQTRVVRDFVLAGGAMIVFPGPESDLTYFNRELLPRLFPGQLSSLIGNVTGGVSLFLDGSRAQHPICHGLFPENEADRPSFSKIFSLVPHKDLEYLLYFNDTRPALSVGWLSGGRVALFAVPLDLEWTDLPLKGMFLPLIQRLVRYVAFGTDARRGYTVGQSVRFRLPYADIRSRVQAQAPSGRRLDLEANLPSGSRPYWEIPKVDEAGLWLLRRDEEVVKHVVVNVDPNEGMLDRVTEEKLQRLFGAEQTHFVYGGDDLETRVLNNRYGRELWREVVVAALLLLALELWLARAPGPAVRAERRRAVSRRAF